MKLITLLIAVALLAAACGSGINDPSDNPASGPESVPLIMAAAVEQLISQDHSFGDGPPPFTEYLLQTSIDPAAGTADGSSSAQPRHLSDAERAAIEAAVGSYGPVRWIDDPAEWITDDLRPTVDGAVIIGVGEPELSEGSAEAPVSLWCGGVCGVWLTYRLELGSGVWAVTGIEGPIAIS